MAQTIDSPFSFLLDYASLRQKTAIKGSRGSIETLLFVSETMAIRGAKCATIAVVNHQFQGGTPYS